jgi:hypothetical protein
LLSRDFHPARNAKLSWRTNVLHRNSRTISAFLLRWLRPGQKGIRRRLRLIIYIGIAGVYIFQIVAIDWSTALTFPNIIWNQRPITIIALWLFIPCAYLLLHTWRSSEIYPFKLVAYLSGFMFSLYLLFFYVFWIYPTLPQEFGGMRPRCAYIDIEISKISDKTLKEVFIDSVIVNNPNVIRSERVDVLYVGSEVIIIKPQSSITQTVYEIRKENISSIVWCE